MARAQTKSLHNGNPLLYWATLAYVVGIPNFVHFDPTGRTAEPINFTSIMTIIQTVMTGYLFVVLLLLDRRPVFWRKINISMSLWIALLLQFTLASVLQPTSHITPRLSTDMVFAVFLLSQWVVVFLLVVVLYSRALPGKATELMVQLIGRASWIWIVMVWLILPIMPTQVYGAADESSAAIRQLGGELIHPGKLATLAGVAFFYAFLFFPPGARKWLACGLAMVTLALTSARTGELGFLIAFALYLMIFSGSTVLRWVTAFAVLPLSVVAVTFREALLKYVARGQSTQSLASLDDRTRIWIASWEAIKLRPFLGYGFVVGARKALRDRWIFTHWIPPHSHNEFIGTVMDGGFIALVPMLCLYGLVLWRACRDARRGMYEQFFLVVFLQILVTSFSGPILSYRYQILGGVLMLCAVGVLGRASATRQAAGPQPGRARVVDETVPAQMATS